MVGTQRGDDEVEPDYARGQAHDEPGTSAPDFARGQRRDAMDPHEGDFAGADEDRGEHREPTDHGDFARGQRQDPDPG